MIRQKEHDMNNQPNKRTMLILVGMLDALLGGAVLLIYFGLLPVDISSWGIPRWIVGVVGGVWFLGALAVVAYQLTKTDVSE
jgi:hypothetical protein